MYFVDAPTVTRDFWTGQASPDVYFFIALFTATTYLLAGWAREQVCTYMCPWPRFQSAMLDEQSLTVTYQAWRGEPRGRGKRGSAGAPRRLRRLRRLRHVCPTGIDIRDGMQLECIDCGLCIDACNDVMAQDRPAGLADHLGHAGRQEAKAAGTTPDLRSCGRAPSSTVACPCRRGDGARRWRCGRASACRCSMTARRCSCGSPTASAQRLYREDRQQDADAGDSRNHATASRAPC